MESIPYISMNDFNPIRLTAGSKLHESVGGQIELSEKEGTFGLRDSTGGELLWIIEKGREQTMSGDRARLNNIWNTDLDIYVLMNIYSNGKIHYIIDCESKTSSAMLTIKSITVPGIKEKRKVITKENKKYHIFCKKILKIS